MEFYNDTDRETVFNVEWSIWLITDLLKRLISAHIVIYWLKWDPLS